MDRSWMMLKDRTLPQYEVGVNQFLTFAYSSKEPSEKIRCPCKKCNNVYFRTRDDVEGDLYQYGIVDDYAIWMLHGEEFENSDDDNSDGNGEDREYDIDGMGEKDITGDQQNYVDTQTMLEDASTRTRTHTEKQTNNDSSLLKWESERFMRLLRDADKELYPGCKVQVGSLTV